MVGFALDFLLAVRRCAFPFPPVHSLVFFLVCVATFVNVLVSSALLKFTPRVSRQHDRVSDAT